jgi:hypothetical protein
VTRALILVLMVVKLLHSLTAMRKLLRMPVLVQRNLVVVQVQVQVQVRVQGPRNWTAVLELVQRSWVAMPVLLVLARVQELVQG